MQMIPIRQDIEILPADEPRSKSPIIIDDKGELKQNKVTGWTVAENIGISIINPRALSKLTKVEK